jgi:hypothetical protein
MPVLHKYADKQNHYVLTTIRGNIITFQLTQKGETKLMDAGVKNSQTFGRALLLDLIRSGDAYTQGSGPGKIDANYDDRQMELDFKDDPEPETMFPSCHDCSSLNDLHFVEIKGVESKGSILCPSCRSKRSVEIDTSIPIFLLTRSLLNQLLKKKNIEKLDDSVIAYQELLNAEFESKWDVFMKSKLSQQRLFEKDQGKQSKLF